MKLKNYLSTRSIGQSIVRRVSIFALLLSVLLLPMLHHHPAYDHAHGDAEGHQHQPAVHADFFPDRTHEHGHHDDHDQHDLGVGGAVESSHHALSQIDLLSLHIGQSFQFSSVFKRNPLAFAQAEPALSIFPHLQRRASNDQNALPPKVLRFSPLSLRAPPYYV